jgi:hypothetical protein
VIFGCLVFFLCFEFCFVDYGVGGGDAVLLVVTLIMIPDFYLVALEDSIDGCYFT